MCSKYLNTLLHFRLCLVVDATCAIPKYYQAFWFSMENGEERNIEITNTDYKVEGFEGSCIMRKDDDKPVDAENHYNTKIVLLDKYICVFQL